MSPRLASRTHKVTSGIPAQRGANANEPTGAEQRTARIMGGWFLATFVFSIPALWFYDPVLHDTGYVLGGGADTRVALGAVCEILTAVAGIATAVVIFPIAKRVSESVALGYVASRTLESTVIVSGVVSLMAVLGARTWPAPAAPTRRWSPSGGAWSRSTTRRSCSGRSSAPASGTASCWAT